MENLNPELIGCGLLQPTHCPQQSLHVSLASGSRINLWLSIDSLDKEAPVTQAPSRAPTFLPLAAEPLKSHREAAQI